MPDFGPFTRVIDLGPNSAPHVTGRRWWFLWPVLGYKVLVPVRKLGALNIFERHILALSRAGVVEAERIAELLGLPLDLVATILLEQQHRGRMDHLGGLTKVALRILDEEEKTPEVESVGWVFRNALDEQGRLLPRFYGDSLRTARIMQDDLSRRTQRTKVEVGSTGSQSIESPTIIWPHRGKEAVRPTATEILRAARRHFKTEGAISRHGGAQGSEQSVGRATSERLHQVACEAKPEPLFLITYLCELPRASTSRNWLVADPFGLGASVELADDLVQARESQRLLNSFLEGTVDRLAEVDAEEWREQRQAEAGAAERTVTELLGVPGSEVPDQIRNQLVAAERQNLVTLLDPSPSPRALGLGDAKRLENGVRHHHAAIEESLAWIARMFAEPADVVALSSEPNLNRSLLIGLAKAIGFLEADAPEAKGILFASAGGVRNVLEFQGSELRSALAAALLSAPRHPNHPLRHLATECQDALVALRRIWQLRGEGSHATPTPADVEAVRGARLDTYRILRCLLCTAPSPSSGEGDGEATLPDSAIALKVRARADREVSEALGQLSCPPEIRTRLIEAAEGWINVTTLAKTGEVNASDLADVLVSLTIVLESLVQHLPTQPEDNALGDEDRGERLNAIALSLGFDLGPSGVVAPEIARADSGRIARVARGQRGTLSAHLVAALLAASRDPERCLAEVAKECPQFLVYAARLVSARGHGAGDQVRMEDIADLVPRTYESVRALLKAIQ